MKTYNANVMIDKAKISFQVKAHNQDHASRRSKDFLQQVLGLMINRKSLQVEITEVAA